MVKFIIPSSDEDSADEILDDFKHSDNEEPDNDETGKENKAANEEETDGDDNETTFQESNSAKLQLMNYTLFPSQDSNQFEFDEDASDHDFDSPMRPFGLVTSSTSQSTKLFPSSPPTTPASEPVEHVDEAMYVLEPEPNAVLPRRFEYQSRGFDLAIPASSITERTRTCSFPFRVGWGPRGQFVHTAGRTVIAINKIEIRPPNSQISLEKARQQIISHLNAHFHTPPPPRDRAPIAGEVCQACWEPVPAKSAFRCLLCPVISHVECVSLVRSQAERKEQKRDHESNTFVCSHHTCKVCGEQETSTCEMCPHAFCETHIPGFAIRRENSQGILCSSECDEKAKNSNFRLVNSHLASLCNKYDNETQVPHPTLGGLELSEDRSVWELVKRLWCREFGGRTGGYEDVYARRTSLSRWLEDTIRAEIEQEAKRSKTDADKILTFLVGHNIQRACKHAFETKNFRLGTLLAQAGEGCTLREDIRNQTDNWKKTGAWGLLSEPFQNIYLLLGGGAFEEGLRPWAKEYFKRLTWLQAFGLQLWFAESPQNVSIEHALGQYQDAVKGKIAPAPLPLNKRQEGGHASEDVRMGLLKYYCHSLKFASKQLLLDQQNNLGQSGLSSLLRPEAWGRDPLDGALVWHLHDLLQFTPAYSIDEFPRLDNLYMNYIWQLEAMGEWEWAIYVALHPPAGGNAWEANEELAKEILMRNVSLSFDFCSLPDVNVSQDPFVTFLEGSEPAAESSFLLSTRTTGLHGSNPQILPYLAGCKSSWWHEAQAVRARYDRLPSLEFAHLLACVGEDPHTGQASLERAAKVVTTQLRPLYSLTDRLSDRKFMSELDNYLAPYLHLLPDVAPEFRLNEPEAEVLVSEPRLTSARTIHKLTLERSIPLSKELLGEFKRFAASFDY